MTIRNDINDLGTTRVMEIPLWRQRLICESRDLDLKIRKLSKFIEDQASPLPPELALLPSQLKAMQAYAAILRTRLAGFGPDGEFAAIGYLGDID